MIEHSVTGRCFWCDWGYTTTWEFIRETAKDHLDQGCRGPIVAVTREGEREVPPMATFRKDAP